MRRTRTWKANFRGRQKEGYTPFDHGQNFRGRGRCEYHQREISPSFSVIIVKNIGILVMSVDKDLKWKR